MSFHLNPLNSDADYVVKTQRIYIDPQQLIALKNKRKSFTMVPSLYEPPQDQLSFKQSWNHTTDHSFIQNKTLPNSQKRFSKPFLQTDSQTFPLQKIKLLEEVLQGQNIAPNVEFIWKMLPSTTKKHITNFQEGDCIPFKGNNDEKYLILSGEVRVIGTNDHQFKRKAGFFFFLSTQTSAKIKQIVALRSTKLLKIPNNIYQSLIKNYLYLKNSQKIKFIQFCPFLIWKYQLTEDLASCMEMKQTEKEEIIYQANSSPDFIYFVKEGIVLLERNNKLMNPVVEDYEQHYEKNEISEKDTILVVRKGMAFGIDGIIIKEFTPSVLLNLQIDQAVIEKKERETIMQQYSRQEQKFESKDQQNPQKQFLTTNAARKNLRIYTAKTLGKCELYCLDKKILETLFSISDINEQIYAKKKQIRPQELERMSIEYTNMILNNINPQMAQVAVKKKELVLKIENKAFPKSKSLAVLENRHSKGQVKGERLNHSPKAFLLRNKKQVNHQNTKADAEIKNKFYLNEQRQRNELRNRIKGEREKEKVMRVKKANNQNSVMRKDNQDLYILPKIGGSQERGQENKVFKKQTFKQKQKLDEIIGMKLKEGLKQYGKGPEVGKNVGNISISHQFVSKESELSKLLEESKDSKSNPSFINVKSYKSIISVYESVKNH